MEKMEKREIPQITSANLAACAGNPFAAAAILGVACAADLAICSMVAVAEFWGVGAAEAL